jgi:hypothetical protein
VTTLAVQTPTEVGGNLTYTSVSDGILVFPAASGQRYLILWRNTGGSTSVPTIDDPTSATPVGAVAFNPDLVGFTVPITTGATAQLINASRFRDASGNVNATMTNAASLTAAVLGPF